MQLKNTYNWRINKTVTTAINFIRKRRLHVTTILQDSIIISSRRIMRESEYPRPNSDWPRTQPRTRRKHARSEKEAKVRAITAAHRTTQSIASGACVRIARSLTSLLTISNRTAPSSYMNKNASPTRRSTHSHERLQLKLIPPLG